MAASPTCQVKDGAGAYVSTTDGVNVTAANTITIKLVSQAGVQSWSLSCIGTDENQVAATINSGLTIDGVLKTASFTMPVAGTALIFQSTVTDTNGTSTSTTFGIYTLLSSGNRVGACGEGNEGNSTFGWTTKLNGLLRSGPNVTLATGSLPVANGGSGVTVTQPCLSLLSDFGSTTSTAAQSTNLTFSVGASDIWLIEFGGTWSVASGTSGAKLAIAIPTSATIEGEAHGELGTGLDTYHSARITAGGTLTTAFNTVAATAEGYHGWARVKMDGTHSGSITFQVAPVAAVVLTVKAGSWMRAHQVTEV